MERLNIRRGPVAMKNRVGCPYDESEVRTSTVAEYHEAAQCLAEAFANDEVARYFIDTEDMSTYSEGFKWKLHYDILRYVVAAHCYNGIVTTVGPNHNAVALWMPPGKNMDDWWTLLRSGLWRLYFRLSREGKARFYGEFLPLLHTTKHEVLQKRDNNSLYLVYIGTKPGDRGKGYARALIEHGIAMVGAQFDIMPFSTLWGDRLADAANIPTYLESSAKVNELYYEKFGFVLKKEIALKRAERPLRLGIMVRDPKNSTLIGSSKMKDVVTVVKRMR